MDRQTLRDWVHRFNAQGPDGLKDIRSKGHPSRLAPEQLAALAEIVETGPDREKNGVVRWRRIDLMSIPTKAPGNYEIMAPINSWMMPPPVIPTAFQSDSKGIPILVLI